MTTPMTPPQPPRRGRGPGVRVDAARLWSGGVATAVVAGLIALAGILVCRWLFDIPVLAPRRDGAYGDAHTTAMALVAAVVALAATGLIYLLLLSTPRPIAFFGWIIGIATLLMVVFPFRTSAPLSAKFATSIVDLVLGIAIGSLVSSVAQRSVRSGAGGGYIATDSVPTSTDL